MQLFCRVHTDSLDSTQITQSAHGHVGHCKWLVNDQLWNLIAQRTARSLIGEIIKFYYQELFRFCNHWFLLKIINENVILDISIRIWPPWQYNGLIGETNAYKSRKKFSLRKIGMVVWVHIYYYCYWGNKWLWYQDPDLPCYLIHN